jgi:epoxyqueuosine reductase QueG
MGSYQGSNNVFTASYCRRTVVDDNGTALSFGNLKNLCDPCFGICPYSKFHTPRSR